MISDIDSHDVSVFRFGVRLVALFTTPAIAFLSHLLVASGGRAGRVSKSVFGFAHHDDRALGLEEELLGGVEIGACGLEFLKGHSRASVAFEVGCMRAESGALSLLIEPVAKLVRAFVLGVDLDGAASKCVQRLA